MRMRSLNQLTIAPTYIFFAIGERTFITVQCSLDKAWALRIIISAHSQPETDSKAGLAAEDDTAKGRTRC